MARTFTEEIPLGFPAPSFSLPDVVAGKIRSLDELKSKTATVIMFICNHCPYVIHVREELVKLANDYIPKGISFIAINSNDIINYPQDAPEKMKELALEMKFPFPYLFDETQEIAKAYHAACTPDFSIFDKNMKCVYRGQLDGSRPGSGIPVTGEDIRKALEALIKDEKINSRQIPSMGCNIKWKQ